VTDGDSKPQKPPEDSSEEPATKPAKESAKEPDKKSGEDRSKAHSPPPKGAGRSRGEHRASIAEEVPDPPARRIRWSKTWRIIPSRYPPIQLFERLGDPEDWEALAEIEGLTNDRLRQEIGDISRIPVEERIAGPGASWVMASFTHIGRPSRFSDGGYGVYYCARTMETAVAETTYHMSRFYASTAEPPLNVDMRTLIGHLDGTFHDLREDPAFESLRDPLDYSASQAIGRRLWSEGSNGVVFDSARDPEGECLGAFRPKAVPVPTQGSHLRYHWDGARIDRYFDYAEDRWVQREAGPESDDR